MNCIVATTSPGRDKLRESLAEVVDDYDLIPIDCALSLDQLTINGLTAAGAVAIITHSKLWSANGLIPPVIGDS